VPDTLPTLSSLPEALSLEPPLTLPALSSLPEALSLEPPLTLPALSSLPEALSLEPPLALPALPVLDAQPAKELLTASSSKISFSLQAANIPQKIKTIRGYMSSFPIVESLLVSGIFPSSSALRNGS
jgi:hypothetical protein